VKKETNMKQAKKSLELPKQIDAYFRADKGDAKAVSECFTEDAAVTDEGRTHTGRPAIEKWKTDSSAKFDYASQPFACEEKDGKTVVNSHVVGNFPGSPVDLRYFFRLEGDKIASLEITP
jgi:hypothetical protein